MYCDYLYEVKCSRMLGKWGWILMSVFLDKRGRWGSIWNSRILLVGVSVSTFGCCLFSI